MSPAHKFTKNTIYICLGIALIIFLAIQPYNLFCKVTKNCRQLGFSNIIPAKIGAQKIDFEFGFEMDEDLAKKISIEILQENIVAISGKDIENFYIAKNSGEENLILGSMFQVKPKWVNEYLVRSECICFKEQNISAESSAKMPLYFKVKAEIEKDERFEGLKKVAIKYQFYQLN